MKDSRKTGFKGWLKRSILPFIALSFLGHGILYSSVYLAPGRSLEAPQLIEMEIVDKPAEKSPLDKEDELKKIVDQDKLNNDKDENAKFLSSHNQRVEKQTAARKLGEFKNIRKAGPEGDSAPAKPTTKWAQFMPQFDVSKSLKDLSAREQKFKDGEVELPSAHKAKPEVSENAQNEKPASRAGSEVSQTLDYIKELEPGLETMLSTKEFKYFTFFSRVRQQINQHWTPKVRTKVDQIYKQGRRIASTEDMITRCLVTLDKSGKLIRIQIIGVSGIRELDEAATEAFRAAAPFPNPPQGMVDPDGTIKIRWDFILEA